MKLVLPRLASQSRAIPVPSRFMDCITPPPPPPRQFPSSSRFSHLISPLSQFSIHDLESILSPSPLASQLQNCLSVSKELSYPLPDSEMWIWVLALTKIETNMLDRHLIDHFKRQRQRISRNPRLAEFENALLLPSRSLCNQRLEFLGDAVLNTSGAVFASINWPDAHEGTLTNIKWNLVSNYALAELVHQHWPVLCSASYKSVDLLSSSAASSSPSPSSSIQTTPSQLMGLLDLAGSNVNPPISSTKLSEFPIKQKKIVADCMEALVGAVYAVHGFERASECATQWIYEPILKSHSRRELETMSSAALLHSEATRLWIATPEYRFERVQPNNYTVTVSVGGEDFTSFENKTLVQGRRAAAEIALKKLKQKQK